jgi:MFS family permease
MKNKKSFYPWVIMVCCFIIQGLSVGLVFNSRGQFLVPVSESLGLKLKDLTMYTLFMGVASFAFMPFAAKLIRKIDVRIATGCSLVLFAVSSIVFSLSKGLTGFFIGGALSGLAMPLGYTLTMPLVLDNWFVEKKGLVFGIVSSASGIFAAISNPLLAGIIEKFGWQCGYRFQASIFLFITVPVAVFVLRMHPSDKGLEPYGYDPSKDAVGREEPSNTGVSSKTAVKSLTFLMIIITGIIVGVTATFSQMLQGYIMSLGKSAVFAATIVSISMIGNVFCKLFLGAISDKSGTDKALYFGIVMSIVSFVMLYFNRIVPLIYIGSFISGMVAALYSGVFPITIKDLFGGREYGTIFSYFSMAISFSSVFGLNIYGNILDIFGGYIPALAFSEACLLLALITAVIAYRSKKKLVFTTEEPKV